MRTTASQAKHAQRSSYASQIRCFQPNLILSVETMSANVKLCRRGNDARTFSSKRFLHWHWMLSVEMFNPYATQDHWVTTSVTIVCTTQNQKGLDLLAKRL